MFIKFKNVTAGMAEAHYCGDESYRMRHVGWVQRRVDGKWIALNHHTVSWANPPQYPQFQTRSGAAWALAHGEVIR
jgi:hypothetical protein